MGLSDEAVEILRALYWCKPCLEGRHNECEAPCGCNIHPPSGKVNMLLEQFRRVGITFDDGQIKQIQTHSENQTNA